jgi:hypothetical protein
MKGIALFPIAVAVLAGVAAYQAPASGRADKQADEQAAPIYGVKIPRGYWQWKLIAVSEIAVGDHSQLRAEFGNDIAIKAFQEKKLPFPDGAIIVAQHWTKESSPGNDKVLTRLPMGAGAASPKSFVPGPVVNFQVMVKDSKKYAASAGWGFADFKDGKPSDEALHKNCFPCHEPAKDRDFVFTRYAP